MDMKPFFEQTAQQIAKTFFVRLRYYYPGGYNAILDLPHPQGGPPQPLEKNRRERHLDQKAETKMGDILWSKMELFPTS